MTFSVSVEGDAKDKGAVCRRNPRDSCEKGLYIPMSDVLQRFRGLGNEYPHGGSTPLNKKGYKDRSCPIAYLSL